jgi:hypothetical protein
MSIGKRLLFILGAYVSTVLLLVLGFVIFNLIEDELFQPLPWEFVFICPAVIVGSQLIFILPMVKPPRLLTQGKSLLLSACMASVIASILTLGLWSLVYSIFMNLVLDVPKEDKIQEGFF